MPYRIPLHRMFKGIFVGFVIASIVVLLRTFAIVSWQKLTLTFRNLKSLPSSCEELFKHKHKLNQTCTDILLYSIITTPKRLAHFHKNELV